VYNVPLLFQLEAPVPAEVAPPGPALVPPSQSATHPPAPGALQIPRSRRAPCRARTRAGGLNVYDKLRVVLQIHKKIGRTLNVEEVLPKILDGLFSVFPQSDRGYILLPEGDLGPLVSRPTSTRTKHFRRRHARPDSKTVAERVLSKGEALLLADGLASRFQH